MKQNFEDWKKNNPNSSINDYYKLGNRETIQEISIETKSTIYPIHTAVNQNSNYNLIIGISVSLIGFIGYFLPWFKLPIFNISISGNDIMQLANFFKSHIPKTNASLLKYTFVIPISYGVVLLGTVSKSYFISVLGIVLNLLTVGFLLGKLFLDIPDLLPYLSIGLYLMILSWFLMIYYMIILK